jgi:hypothetical protein
MLVGKLLLKSTAAPSGVIVNGSPLPTPGSVSKNPSASTICADNEAFNSKAKIAVMIVFISFLVL